MRPGLSRFTRVHRVPTALLSVYDKTGIVDFARSLSELGWDLLSSGGTATVLAQAGLVVTDVADRTGSPAMLGHRVVTLHPAVHGGLLADLDNAEHRADLERYGIEPIALAVINLYPFSSDPSIELIDVGGPAMVRAAAKNHAHVGVVVDPDDYGPVLAELRTSAALTLETRRRLARRAFAVTAAYDTAIVAWLDATSTDSSTGPLPQSLAVVAELTQPLRYGENPHQAGARYRFSGARSWWDSAQQLGGKELSYLNLFDAEAAWTLAHRLDRGVGEAACVVVKHANPCGVAVAADVAQAYRRAHECDPVSAFGGIVAITGVVTLDAARTLSEVFTEVVVAPDFDADALELLSAKKNLRLLKAQPPVGTALDMRSIDGGLLVQQVDDVSTDRSGWSVVSVAQPDDDMWNDIVMAWQVCAAVSSNAIVLVKDRQAFGVGAGQQNRLDSARIAVERAGGRATGGVAASDAFFPFRDGLDAVAAAGVRAVVQPGGSVRDAEVIAAADEHGVVLVFTGQRHFRH
jgi:phosphoribosylaminoimidazolecarboxamide formyltransferase/IMP cyclohydrolase